VSAPSALAPSVSSLISGFLPWLALASSPPPASSGSTQRPTPSPQPTTSGGHGSTPTSAPAFNPMRQPFPDRHTAAFQSAAAATLKFAIDNTDSLPTLSQHAWFLSVLIHRTHLFTTGSPYDTFPSVDSDLIPALYHVNEDQVDMYNQSNKRWETIFDFTDRETTFLNRVTSLTDSWLRFKLT